MERRNEELWGNGRAVTGLKKTEDRREKKAEKKLNMERKAVRVEGKQGKKENERK